MPPESFSNWQSTAIGRNLSKKLNHLGSNACEEHLLNEYYNSSDALANYTARSCSALARTITRRPKRVAANKMHPQGYFMATNVEESSTCGYEAAQVMRLLKLLLRSGIKFPALPGGLVMLVETVETEPRMVSWLRCEEYSKLSRSTREFFKF
ncbi:hypothetical protein BGZ92_011340 [Podila epicladia]|nr:hypothetical protein BGZ92_011340 [Podila epicladia]